ncbi:MAG: hypothetical protein WCG20_01735 [bacterium]
MQMNEHLTKLQKEQGNLCLQIRAQWNLIPEIVRDRHRNNTFDVLTYFFKEIIAACNEHFLCIEFNVPSFQTLGSEGIRALEFLCKFSKQLNFFTIYDANFSSSTANIHVAMRPTQQLSEYVFTMAQAVTVNPYFGNSDGIGHFLMAPSESGAFVTTRTKGFDADEFQTLLVAADAQTFQYWDKFGNYAKDLVSILDQKLIPLWLLTTYRVSDRWEFPGKCSISMNSNDLVNDIRLARKVIQKEMFIKVPYSNDMKQIIDNGRLENTNRGVIVTVSDQIIYFGRDEQFAEASRARAQFYKEQLA